MVLAGALILGILEKPLKWYNITVSILVIVLVLGGEPVKIVYFLAYFAIELAIVKYMNGLEGLREGNYGYTGFCFIFNNTINIL